jgi:hypothetical protein
MLRLHNRVVASAQKGTLSYLPFTGFGLLLAFMSATVSLGRYPDI